MIHGIIFLLVCIRVFTRTSAVVVEAVVMLVLIFRFQSWMMMEVCISSLNQRKRTSAVERRMRTLYSPSMLMHQQVWWR